MLAYLGTTEIVVIACVVVLLFGAGAIPKFAKSIGKAKKEFEKGQKEALEEGSDDDAESGDKS
jgi:sec-independent protein translocase protein TatA